MREPLSRQGIIGFGLVVGGLVSLTDTLWRGFAQAWDGTHLLFSLIVFGALAIIGLTLLMHDIRSNGASLANTNFSIMSSKTNIGLIVLIGGIAGIGEGITRLVASGTNSMSLSVFLVLAIVWGVACIWLFLQPNS